MTTTAPVEDDFETIRRRRITTEPLGYVAPLDGLRALAVIGVLLYHARFPWIPGGYLGVSTFFTLSGFLITSLLLREWNRDDAIDLRSFWMRRFRRLLPASWFTMGLVVVMGALGIWDTDQLRHLRGDLPFALLEVANWHFIFAGRTYGDAFTAPSPLEHFWSLAVEQQFYVVLPVLVLAVLSIGASARPARQRVGRLVIVLGMLTVVSAALNGAFAPGSTDRSYFGTDTRMAELLIGALLACFTLRRLRFPPGPGRVLAVGAGIAGLAGTFWLWHQAPLGSSWMYPWGLLLTAVCTSGILVGLLQDGPLARVFSFGPLLWVGRVSYGIYLLHWPVFLWLTPARIGWSQWPLFALRMAVTLAAAALMFRLIENPVRSGGRLAGRPAVIVAAVAALALLGGNLFVTRDLPEPGSLSRAGTPPTATDAPTTTAPPPPLRTLVVGDSLAESLGTRLAGLDGFETSTATSGYCGLALGGWIARGDNSVERDVRRCAGEREEWVDAVEEYAPEVVLVHGGLRDVTDRRLRQESPWAGPGDPEIDDFLTTDIGGLVDQLDRTGAEVVVLAMPYVENTLVPPALPPEPLPADPTTAALLTMEEFAIAAGVPETGFRENDPTRVDRFNQLLESVAESRGIRFFDPAEAAEEWEEGVLDPQMRPDGVGYSDEAGAAIGEWLEPQLRTRVDSAPPAESSPLLDPEAPLPEPPPPMERRRAPAGVQPDVLVVGDSIALNYGYGLTQWARAGGPASVNNSAVLGCPVARGGSYRFKRDLLHFADDCDWATYYPQRLNTVRPEVVALSSGIWEIVDRRLPGDDRFRSIGDPGFDRYVLREFLLAIDVLGSDGASVVVLTQPHIEAGLNQGFTGLPESDPARTDRLNEILREAVSLRPGVATLIDLQAWLAAQPGGEVDPAKRPDGVHFTDEYSPEIGAWLGPQLVDVARG
jgi:peptidoglycan/LPS O-acetylase OafA/YrhL